MLASFAAARADSATFGIWTRVFVKIRGELHYLWRAVDQDGDVLDILVQKRRNKHAAARFFGTLLKNQQAVPTKIVTDKLKSYSAAKRDVMPAVPHCTRRYSNNSEQERRVVSEANPEGGRQDVAHNRAERSHQRTRQRERQMRGFKSQGQAQRFLAVHGRVINLFVVGRHHMSAKNYRLFRNRALVQWNEVVGAA